MVIAYLLHWLPYATQERQIFAIYYAPSYYFAILLAAHAWHAIACQPLRPSVAAVATVLVCVGVGEVSLRLAPIAYASPSRVDEWTAALRLASTECWNGAACWVDAEAVNT